MKTLRNPCAAAVAALIMCGCMQNPPQTTSPDQGATTTMPGADASVASGAFMRLDVNHDGYVSRDEYTVNGNTGQSFDSCDVDHDGKLNRAEFIQCAQQPQSTKPAQQ